MSTVNRRTVVSAAWAAPVIALAVATPAAAASEPSTSAELVWTNLTATAGSKPNVIYANTKIMNTGDTATGPVTLYVSVDGAETQTFTWPSIPAWGNTEQVNVEFSGMEKGKTHTVYFFAETGAQQLEGRVIMTAPEWWL